MDMRPENSMYHKKKVKMEHLHHVPTVVEAGDLLWSLDMKSAYYLVGVDPRLGATMGSNGKAGTIDSRCYHLGLQAVRMLSLR